MLGSPKEPPFVDSFLFAPLSHFRARFLLRDVLLLAQVTGRQICNLFQCPPGRNWKELADVVTLLKLTLSRRCVVE